MKVIAGIVGQTAQPTPRPTYGDLIGKVIASEDLTQGAKCAYLVVQNPTPTYEDQVLLVHLEWSGKGASASPVYKKVPLGMGYAVYPDATVVLLGVK